MPPLEIAVPFRGMQLRWTLEHQGGASCEIDLREDQLDDWQAPQRLIIRGERDWAGEVTNLSRSGRPNEIGVSSPNRVGWSASGLGLDTRLDKRIVRHDIAVNDDVDVIVAALLSEAQDDQFNGDMGMSMGDRIGSFPSRLRGYCVGVNIGDAIRELASIGRGFDWEIDADGRLNMWAGSRGVDTGRTLSESQCQGFDIELDTSELLTNVTAIADPSDPYGPKFRMSHVQAASGHFFANAYGRRETSIDTDIIALTQKNANWEQELYDAGRALLRQYLGGMLRVRAWWFSDRAPWSMADVWLQDSVTVDIPAPFGVGDTVDMRVTDVTATVDPMPPRGDAPPIYRIDYTLDALVRDIDMEDGDPDAEGS